MKTNCVVTAVVATLAGGALASDVVTDWQSTYQDVIRVTGGAPCPVSRAGPMMSLAVFDAVNGIDAVNNYSSSYRPYQSGLPTPAADSSKEAAVASAAYQVLTQLHQGNAPALALVNARYNAQLAAIPNGAAKAHGLAYGATVATSLLASRQNDGYDADSSYTFGGQPGDYRTTPDGPNVPPFSPQWGRVTPWGLQSSAQFRPTRLTNYPSMQAFLQSDEYTQNINGGPGVVGVKELGARNSATRTADQTESAWFWANDRNGTSKPPGQLVEISKIVSQDRGLSLSSNARMFALVNMAMGDACIAAWDCKYDTSCDLWRPIDAIRETLNDSNPNTVADPNWLPLNDFTPPFPAYVSGHATMAAAHAGIMAELFGDNVTFTLGSDEFSVNAALGYDPNLTRTFHSFSDAAWENAMSRVYLGVHFQIDAVDGNTLGYQVADYVFDNYLQPVPAPAVAPLFVAGVAFSIRRRRPTV